MMHNEISRLEGTILLLGTDDTTKFICFLKAHSFKISNLPPE